MLNSDLHTRLSLGRLPSMCRFGTWRLCHTIMYFLLTFVAWQLEFTYAQDNPKPSKGHYTNMSVTAAELGHGDSSNNATSLGGGETQYGSILYDKGMLRRSFYVLIGVTCFAVIFFMYRWVRSRSRRKTKKYGVLATRSSDMELRPLDQDDDEEDMTVFDVNSK